MTDMQKNPPYHDRESKAKFVFEKYKDLLVGRVLDVGADQCYLKKYLGNDVQYTGVGFGDGRDIINLDLEKERLPFPDGSFDCVLCLDVLEHLEKIHEVFDELCRVSSEWVIVSFPNPYRCFFQFLTQDKCGQDANLKFYGLPKEREADRHRWFFSFSEAKDFVLYRAGKNGFETADVFVEGLREEDLLNRRATGKIKRFLSRLMKRGPRLRRDFHLPDVLAGTSWFVMKKLQSKHNER